MEDNHTENVYALNVEDEIVYVEDVERGRKGYFCIGCKQQMQAVKPKVTNIRAYFRHDVKFAGSKKCTYSDETYRHKLAKEVLQVYKRIKVPPLYKYPPKGIEGAPNSIRKSTYIEAVKVKIEVPFFEDENGEIRFGKEDNIGDRFLIVKPDVTFFNSKNEPILFVELAATHKIDENKRNKFKKLGIDVVEVSIPKDSSEAIGKAFKTTNRTKWIYNNEQEKFKYVPVPISYTKGVQTIDELQRRLFEESPRCRAAQIGNLIFSINKCLESESYRRTERYLISEISRVEGNTGKAENRWKAICERRRKEAENNLSEEKRNIEIEERKIWGDERKLKEHYKRLETRYYRKRGELEIEEGVIDEEERIGNNPEEFYREIIQREEETIRELIEAQEKIRAKEENFEETRIRFTKQFDQHRRTANIYFEESKTGAIGEIERTESDIRSTPEKYEIVERELRFEIEEEERRIIEELSDRNRQFIREIKAGETGEYELERKITNKINEFNKAMALLKNMPTTFEYRERLQRAYKAARTGAYKNWHSKGEVF